MRTSQSIADSLIFTVRLSSEAHQIATDSSQRQLNADRARQVYLNSLSIYAVEFYLRCMGFKIDGETDDNLDSHNPVMRAFLDVADTIVSGVGKLECRPFLSGETSVRVPREVWHDRAGYIAVQIDADLHAATLVGFRQQVSSEEVPLDQWQSLDALLRYASQLERSTANGEMEMVQPTIYLSRWLHRVFQSGWEAAEMVLSPPQMAWRSRHGLTSSETGAIDRVKVLNLPGMEEPIALLLRLNPKARGELGIQIEVHPTGTQTELPQKLKLVVLDEAQMPVMQAEARGSKTLQFNFSGEPGEQFSLKVVLEEASAIESFEI